MTAALLIAAAFLALAGLSCGWAWLICLGRGAERLAARPAGLFAVVLFVLALMTAGAAMAQTHDHHEFHRDFYRHWKQPGTNVSCCDARVTKDGQEIGDCEPTRAEIRAGVWWAWLRQENRWVEVPDARILRERSPNASPTPIYAGITGRSSASCRPRPAADRTCAEARRSRDLDTSGADNRP